MTFSNGLPKPVVFPVLDGFNRVTTTIGMAWSVFIQAVTSKATAWNIPQEVITSSVSSEFNVRGRVTSLSGPVFYGLVRPVDYPIDARRFIPGIAWDNYLRISTLVIPDVLDYLLDERGSSLEDEAGYYLLSEHGLTTSRAEWNVSSRISSTHKTAWSILETKFTNSEMLFNVRKLVKVPALNEVTWINQVAQPVVHPVDASDIPDAPSAQWNITKTVSVSKAIRFSSRNSVSVTRSVTWNTKDVHVTVTKAAAWNTLERVTSVLPTEIQDEIFAYILDEEGNYLLSEVGSNAPTVSWNVIRTLRILRPVLWDDRSSLTSARRTLWNTRNPVITTARTLWNLDSRIAASRNLRWRYLAGVRRSSTSRWNALFEITLRQWQLTSQSPGSLAVPVVHPVDARNPAMMPLSGKGLSNQVVHPVDYNYTPSLNMMATPGIAWRTGLNPSGRVAVTAAIAFNDLKLVSRTASIQWKSVPRIAVTQRSLFNTLNAAETRAEIQWVVGAWVRSHIRTLSQERIDFAY
jgi:hypothetical protein